MNKYIIKLEGSESPKMKQKWCNDEAVITNDNIDEFILDCKKRCEDGTYYKHMVAILDFDTGRKIDSFRCDSDDIISYYQKMLGKYI